MTNWWPDYSPTRRERWLLRWRKLGWKALLWWVPVPGLEPRTITFPLIQNPGQTLTAREIVESQPMD